MSNLFYSNINRDDSLLKKVGFKWPLLFIAVACLILAGCASQPKKTASSKKPKEYFAESKYGVKASPKVVKHAHAKVPKGGGRKQIGKPYKIAGKWYYPKEDKNYRRVGYASWYGSAFHGRKTANGEVYDMNAISAAHPTLPLPSYVKVTNVSNGKSIVVRVNDRGPFHNNRVIDLSKRTAEILETKSDGIAKVEVEYLGPARMDGEDDWLMATLQENGRFVHNGARTLIAQNMPQETKSTSRVASLLSSRTLVAANTLPAGALNQSNNNSATIADLWNSSKPSDNNNTSSSQRLSVASNSTVTLPEFAPLAPRRVDTLSQLSNNNITVASNSLSSNAVGNSSVSTNSTNASNNTPLNLDDQAAKAPEFSRDIPPQIDNKEEKSITIAQKRNRSENEQKTTSIFNLLSKPIFQVK